MDIVKQKQIREWTLLSLVGAMALVANLPAHVLGNIGVERGLLMAILGVMVVIGTVPLCAPLLLSALCAVGHRRQPAGKMGESLGISQAPMLQR